MLRCVRSSMSKLNFPPFIASNTDGCPRHFMYPDSANVSPLNLFVYFLRVSRTVSRSHTAAVQNGHLGCPALCPMLTAAHRLYPPAMLPAAHDTHIEPGCVRGHVVGCAAAQHGLFPVNTTHSSPSGSQQTWHAFPSPFWTSHRATGATSRKIVVCWARDCTPHSRRGHFAPLHTQQGSAARFRLPSEFAHFTTTAAEASRTRTMPRLRRR